MRLDVPVAFVIALVCLAALLCILVGVRVGMLIGRLKAERGFADRLADGRSDAVKRSRATLGGQFLEQLAPYLPDFPAEPTEVRFIGKPVDFVAFRGASAGAVERVTFIEVKSGGSKLSTVERTLRDAIESGRVDWVEYRVPGADAD